MNDCKRNFASDNSDDKYPVDVDIPCCFPPSTNPSHVSHASNASNTSKVGVCIHQSYRDPLTSIYSNERVKFNKWKSGTSIT